MGSPLLVTDTSVEATNRALIDLSSRINQLAGTPGALVINPVADTAVNFTSRNPVLLSGQLGYETDTKFFKIGDGTTAWTSLSYQSVKNAPLPQTAAGVGQFKALLSATNTALYLTDTGGVGGTALPGTWQWIGWLVVVATAGMLDPTTSALEPCGILAGGSQIFPAQGGAYKTRAIIWRIE
jgi:hypothetical protein